MLNRFFLILLGVSLTLSALSLPAAAQNLFLNPLPVKVCDPANAANCIKPGADGSIATGGSVVEGTTTDDPATGCPNSTSAGTMNACLKSIKASVNGPIPQACTGNIPISQITSTDLKTGTGKIYICSIKITAGDAENLSLVEGTGSVCATNTVALDGATTAANGNQIAANGGWAEVSPTYMFSTSVTGNHLCLLQSGTGRVAGHITYSDH